MKVRIISRPVCEQISAPGAFHEIRVKTHALGNAGEKAECGRGAREKFQINQRFEPQAADFQQALQSRCDNFSQARGVDREHIFLRNQVMRVEDETVFIKYQEPDIFASEFFHRVTDRSAGKNG